MIHYYWDILKYWIPSCLAVVVTFLTSSTSFAQDVPSNLEWKKICDGIEHTNFKIEEPLLNVNVLRIDATNPNLTFHTTPRSKNWVADENETDRRTLPDSVVEENMIVAVNANFYQPFNAHTRVSRGPADNKGLVVSNGVLVSPTLDGFASFIQNKDRTVEIRTVRKGDSLDNIQTAVSGHNTVLKNGKCPLINLVESQPYLKDRHPRTVVGISKDKKFVYFVTIDGRQPEFSVGTSILESAEIMQQLGAYDALNLDGGGSTTMVYRDESGKPVVLNRPVGLGPANTLRHNANALGVKLSENK